MEDIFSHDPESDDPFGFFTESDRHLFELAALATGGVLRELHGDAAHRALIGILPAAELTTRRIDGHELITRLDFQDDRYELVARFIRLGGVVVKTSQATLDEVKTLRNPIT